MRSYFGDVPCKHSGNSVSRTIGKLTLNFSTSTNEIEAERTSQHRSETYEQEKNMSYSMKICWKMQSQV